MKTALPGRCAGTRWATATERVLPMDKSLLDHLHSSLLVADGAIGTMLYARGVPLEVCFDETNLSRPDLTDLNADNDIQMNTD